jgi:histidinol-phosphate phosphatase family protein
MQSGILVVRFGSLGDVVLTSATVLNLKLAFPDHHLVYLTRERFGSLVERFDGVDRVETVPDRLSAVGLFKRLLEIEASNFEQIIDLHGNFRSWLTRAVISANRKSVYPKRRWERWRVTRRKKTLPTDYPHTIDLYNETLLAQGKRAHCRRPLLAAPDIKVEFSAVVDTPRPIVLMAPGAAHPTKAWPVDRFAAVAEVLRKEHGARVIWAITRNESSTCALPPGLKDQDIIELVDCPTDQLAAIAAHARLAITNDSGVGHLASAVGTPVLALFGPTHPVLGFAPRGLRDRVIQVDEFCRPCSRHGRKPCWREERYCFTRLSVGSVVAEAVEMLEETANLAPALLVDRDGTIIVDKDYLYDPARVELIPGSGAALRQAREAGYKIVIVSNQSGVARGYHTYEDVEKVNARLRELLEGEGVVVDGFYFCPHHGTKGRVPAYTVDCRCRKPSPGMAEQAALDCGLDLRRSIVIGDSLVDIGLGRVIGARSILVRTGYGAGLVESHRERLERHGVEIADDLNAAVGRLSRSR